MAAAENGIIIRRRQDSDIPALAAMRNMPQVRWGTLSMPFTSVYHTRQRAAAMQPDVVSLVACLGGRVAGEASIIRRSMPRVAHSASLGIMVADDLQHRGVGKALIGALIDLADHWLGVRRLELGVYVDNAPAIALYRRFGFEIEGTEIAEAFRNGEFANSHVMARLRGDLPPDLSPYPALPPAAPAAPFALRASEPEDLQGIAALMAQPIIRHGTLRLPYELAEQAQGLAAPADPATRTIVAEASGQVIGLGVLKPAAMRRAHCASIELIAVHEAWQSRGVGSALLAALLDIADNWLNLKRVHLAVLADNVPALALYRRFGFVAEATKRAEVFRAGGFADTQLMARRRG